MKTPSDDVQPIAIFRPTANERWSARFGSHVVGILTTFLPVVRTTVVMTFCALSLQLNGRSRPIIKWALCCLWAVLFLLTWKAFSRLHNWGSVGHLCACGCQNALHFTPGCHCLCHPVTLSTPCPDPLELWQTWLSFLLALRGWLVSCSQGWSRGLTAQKQTGRSHWRDVKIDGKYQHYQREWIVLTINCVPCRQMETKDC